MEGVIMAQRAAQDRIPLAALDDESLTRLVHASPVEAEAAGRGRFDAPQAFKELARRRWPGIGEMAREIVIDPASQPLLRGAAAVALGTEMTARNQVALLAALPDSDPAVGRHAAMALGKIGDAAALKALTAQPARAEHAGAIAFAASLIAYRWRLAGHVIAAPAMRLKPPPRDAAVLKLAPARQTMLRAITDDLRRELPGIPVSLKGALRFDCGTTPFLVLITEAFALARTPRRFAEAPGIAAVVLKQPGCSERRFALHEYIFVNPSPKGETAAIVGVRAAGIVVHGGEAQIESGAFVLASAPAVQTMAIELAGAVAEATMTLALNELRVGLRHVADQPAPRSPRSAANDHAERLDLRAADADMSR